MRLKRGMKHQESKMNNTYDDINDALQEEYRAYLEMLTVKELIDKVLEFDATGKEDDGFEDYRR